MMNIDVPKGHRVKFKVKGADRVFDSLTIAGECFRRLYIPQKRQHVVIAKVPCAKQIYVRAVLTDPSGDTLVVPFTSIENLQARRLFGHCERKNEVVARFLLLQIRGRPLYRKYIVLVP
jgi:hypothetical protein